jgi:hypothetical protein
MPFYEYRCKKQECGNVQVVRAKEPLDPKSLEELACEKCHAHEMERKISVPYIGSSKSDDLVVPLPGNKVLFGKKIAESPLFKLPCGCMSAKITFYEGQVAKQTELN